MNILQQYNSAKWHTKCSKLQQRIFNDYSKHHPMLAVDTETTGVIFGVPSQLKTKKMLLEFYNKIDTDKLVDDVIQVPGPRVFGISLAVEFENIINLFWARLGTPLYLEAADLIKNKGPKVCHNARYEIRVLTDSGIKMANEIECTYTMSRIYFDRRRKHSLQSLTETICPELSDWEEKLKAMLTRLKTAFTRAGYPKDFVNYSFLPDDLIDRYAMTDAFMCLMLWHYLQERAIW